jgi:16S rRNA (uracil1498-N3)-methyltransferase
VQTSDNLIMADRFFTPDALSTGDYVLKGAEAHHLAAVRRIEQGHRVTLFNGDGLEYQAEVVSVGKRSVHLHITSSSSPRRELQFPLVVASALPKGDRADFLIEKLTELGTTRFVPLIAERSVVRPKHAVVEKYQRAVIEASKQCGRNELMIVETPCGWHEFLARSDLPEKRVVLHVGSEVHLITRPACGVVIAIGPEGGFTAGEIESAVERGWQTLSLGPRVLRVETAAIAAATLLSTGTVG